MSAKIPKRLDENAANSFTQAIVHNMEDKIRNLILMVTNEELEVMTLSVPQGSYSEDNNHPAISSTVVRRFLLISFVNYSNCMDTCRYGYVNLSCIIEPKLRKC